MPATCESLKARHDAIVSHYHEHSDIVRQVQQQCDATVVPELADELAWGDETVALARAFVRDQGKRARFVLSPAVKLVQHTLVWRFKPDSVLRSLEPNKLDPLYTTNALFFFHPDLVDKFGRPCAVINLRHVQRTEDGQLDALKDVIRLGWEVGRRWLTDLSTKAQQATDVKLQIVVIVDLDGAGMSNLEVELLPFFMELLKNHFPGMIGAIFVLNYGWMYAGMWQLAKRVLPNTALERILFPTKADLLEFFEEEHLLQEHGGKVAYTYSPDNPVLAKYGLPLPPSSHAYPSPSPSPSASSTSLSSLASASGSIPRRSSRLSMTSLKSSSTSTGATPLTSAPTSPYQPDQHDDGLGLKRTENVGLDQGTKTTLTEQQQQPSEQQTPRTAFWNWGRRRRATSSGAARVAGDDFIGRATSSSSLTSGQSGLRRVASLAELQEKLAETQRAIDSDDSELSDEIAFEEEAEGERQDDDQESLATEPDRYEVDEDGASSHAGSASTSRVTSTATSARSSRFSSRVPSRNPSREGSPRRRVLLANGLPEEGTAETLSSRARFASSHSLSPYNSSNPYWGYPAFVPSSDPSRIPRPHYQRRRKRDLVRTLTYLAVLRFLALHRSLRNKVKSFVKTLLMVLGLVRRADKPNQDKIQGGSSRTGVDRKSLLEQARNLFAMSPRRPAKFDGNHHNNTIGPPTSILSSSTSHGDIQGSNTRKVVRWDSTSSHHSDGTRRQSYIALSNDPLAARSTSFTVPSMNATVEPSLGLSDRLEQYVWMLIWFTVLRTPDRSAKLVRFIKWSTFELPLWFVDGLMTIVVRASTKVSSGGRQGSGQDAPVSVGTTNRETRMVKRVMAGVGQKLIEWSK
ncbi:hypothetical protein OIV83_002319 [Microbotryomycetes sp. JL201]|nr:hypothetical protein OIV83_002319 [Microbotryomycetes sp. JL201]